MLKDWQDMCIWRLSLIYVSSIMHMNDSCISLNSVHCIVCSSTAHVLCFQPPLFISTLVTLPSVHATLIVTALPCSQGLLW